MASSSSSSSKKNPVITKIEKHLENLRESEASSTSPLQTISIGLNGLTNLYKCVDDAVNYLPPHPHRNTFAHIDQLVNRSKLLLELCTSSREILCRLIEAVVEVKLSDEKKVLEVSRYFSSRKAIVKTARALSVRIRQVEDEFMAENEEELSQGELELTRVFRCVSIINISVMESLLQLLSSNPSRLSRFSNFWVWRSNRVTEVPVVGKGNEMRNVDLALDGVVILKKGKIERVLIAQKSLNQLEMGLREIDSSLCCISSQLNRTKASLLNIVTFYNLISSVF